MMKHAAVFLVAAAFVLPSIAGANDLTFHAGTGSCRPGHGVVPGGAVYDCRLDIGGSVAIAAADCVGSCEVTVAASGVATTNAPARVLLDVHARNPDGFVTQVCGADAMGTAACDGSVRHIVALGPDLCGPFAVRGLEVVRVGDDLLGFGAELMRATTQADFVLCVVDGEPVLTAL